MGSLTLFQLGYCTSYNKMGRVRTKTVKNCQAHHREILHSIDFGFPCEQTYLCGNCHHPKQTPQKQDCWIRHSFDETSATQDCARNFHQTARGNVRGETTTFLRLQSWILTPLKLMLRPRIC